MEDKIYLTVKEYAEREHITSQSVYKQINSGKLQTTTGERDGKKCRLIICSGAGAVADPLRSSEREQDIKYTPAPEITEKAFELLSAQLEEKDKQIAALTAQLEAMTGLLRNAQQLQAHSQLLLQDSTQLSQEETESTRAGAIEEVQVKEYPEKPRRGFWKWLLGEE